jgi:hypothetical protein
MCLLCNLPQTTYCERGISNAFWAEPVNALTNVAFPLAGYLGHTLLKDKKIKSKELLVLPWMLGLVGFGSFAYHTARNSITLIFDALPIYLFILYALFLMLKELLGSKLKASLILTGFIILESILSVYVPREFLNGSIRHIAAITFVSLIGWLAVKQYGRDVLKPLSGVIGLYAFAIFFRSIDAGICSWFPMGTHFLWHVLAAFAGYQAIVLLLCLHAKAKN